MEKFYQLMNIVAQRNYSVEKMKSLEDLEKTYPKSFTLAEIKENIENAILGTSKQIQQYLDNLQGDKEEQERMKTITTHVDDSVFASHIGFLEFLEKAVSERWVTEWPEYFVVALDDIDEETYNTCNHASYCWYIAFKNGEFYNKNYKIADADKPIVGASTVIENRKRLYRDMMRAKDIRIWTMENYRTK